MIRAVTFDADGTLWDFEGAMREALAATLVELQASVPPGGAARADSLTVQHLAALRDRVADELQLEGATLEQVRLESFERALAEVGSPDPTLAAHLTDRYMERRYAATRPYDDVLPALDALTASIPGLILGLISNGNTDPERCGLGGRFQFALYAGPRAAAKPDRHLFEVALREARCEPPMLVHVGDSLPNDVAGAQLLGIRAVWLNRDGLRNTTNIVPDAEIRTLADLPVLLE
jgi:FMN hydrolase / 5-amino-6-(5-phospho-D-ribitylamino)uracil phosphatase